MALVDLDLFHGKAIFFPTSQNCMVNQSQILQMCMEPPGAGVRNFCLGYLGHKLKTAVPFKNLLFQNQKANDHGT